MHTTHTILVLICITANIDNQAYSHPENHKTPPDQQLWSQCQTTGTICQQDNSGNCKISPKGQTKAQQPFISDALSARRFNNAKVLVNKLWHSMLTTHTSVKMVKGTNTEINAKLISNKLATTRSKTVENNLKASNNLSCQVENTKKIQNKKKKIMAQEKKEEEERVKATAEKEKTRRL